MASRGTSGSEISAAEAMVLLPRVLDAIGAAPWWKSTDAELVESLGTFHRAESRIVAAQVSVLSEANQRGLPVEAGAKNAATWLRGLVPVTPSVAGTRGSLAERLPADDMALTREAFAAGDLSVGQAGEVVRTMTALDELPEPVDAETRTEAQRVMLALAGRVDPAQLRKVGLRIQHRLDPDAGQRLAEDEDAQADAREAYLFQERSGMWLLRALLPPVAGACLMAALDPLAAPAPAAGALMDPRAARVRMADALHALAELSLAARSGEPGGLPSRAGSPTRLVLTADLETVLARIGKPGALPGELDTGEPGGWEISSLTVQTLACDAEVVPVLTDQAGRPLDVGSTRYAFPPRIRRAIEVRDRHCSYTGCEAKAPWCHTHHLVAFGRGGPTSEDNGTLLCGRHHRHVHARALVGRLVDGRVVWRPPESDDERGNAYDRDLELAIRALGARWIARNPQILDTG